jgi:hypothetical protein
LNGAVLYFEVIDCSGPVAEVLAIEGGLKTALVAGDLRQNLVRLFARNLANEDVAEARFGSVSLQVDRTGRIDGDLGIVVILHDHVVDDLLAIELHRDIRAHHSDEHAIPIADGLVCKFAGEALIDFVVPKRARAFRRAVLFDARIGRIPDLHLGRSAQIDTTVAPLADLPVDPHLKISIVAGGSEERIVAIADQLAVFNSPVFGEPALHFGV